ncbi:hypothetical protein HNR39_002685 [Glaciimonas immobilis]|uniref:Rap1a immunity protein domain-containing protein n=2 Tax=Glaciimonas immobilis TaxID=728004 RepID=A0A840RT66_9BURK|nr:hypothetical protein [Glaciimonas immobilis]
MQLLKFSLAAIFFILMSGESSADGGNIYYSGNNLMRWIGSDDRINASRPTGGDFLDSGTLIGYVTGSSDAFSGYLFCPPSGATVGQLMAVTKKYVSDRPARWNESASDLVIDALKDAFPCAKRK